MRIFRSRRLRHALIAAGVFAAIAGLFGLENAGYAGRTLTSWEYRFRDVMTVNGRFNPPDNRLAFLGIDSTSVSISNLDLEGLYSAVPRDSPEYRALSLIAAGWPWSREVYALLCEKLINAGARAVIFDLMLPKTSVGDERLQEVLRRYPQQVVVGANFVAETIGPGRQAWSLNLPVSSIVPDAAPDHPSIGYVNFWPSFNGVVRSAQYRATLEQLQFGVNPTGSQAATSAASALAWRAASKLESPQLDHVFDPHLFRFSGPPLTFVATPVYQAFVPDYWQRNFGNGEAVRGKVVLVGPCGNWVHDEHSTPFGLMPGPEIHLHSINALLHHAFISELPAWAGNLFIGLGTLVAWLLTVFVKKTTMRLSSFIGVAVAYFFATKVLYDQASTVMLAVPPFLALALSGLASFIYDYTNETFEKLRIRRTLEAYVSKDVVREVLDNPESYLSKLGGERESVAIIVTDLRGFTTMSEEMDSGQLVAQLNEYLSLMVDDIFANRGSVDKFIGDAILAVWGHVNSDGPVQDVTNALETALMMKASLAKLNSDWEKRGLRTFSMGCGLNFGEVIFGNIGSARKMEPTVIGDAVNTASRLEGLTKDYGRDFILGEAAADLVADTYRLQFVDRVTMKGKTRALKIYSVIGKKNEALDPGMESYLAAYDLAQVSYAAGDFEEARVLFSRCYDHWPNDHLLEVYVSRCDELIESPPDAWAGIHVAKHK